MPTSSADSLLRVFVDSSVLIAAAISATGSARALLLRGLAGELEVWVSSFVLAEIERNLARKAPAALPYFEALRDLLGPYVVDPPDQLVASVALTIEPKDAPIVAAALTARADFLVSYDRKHLLHHQEVILATYGLRVVTPDVVLAERA